jgi:hypothetical protein
VKVNFTIRSDIYRHKNQSHYRPRQALRAPGGWGSHISRQSAHEGGKVVSPAHRPPLLPRKYSWYSFLLEAESTPGPQCDRKDYVNEKFVTPSGIESATFRFIAQCLNQLRHRVHRQKVQLSCQFPHPQTKCALGVNRMYSEWRTLSLAAPFVVTALIACARPSLYLLPPHVSLAVFAHLLKQSNTLSFKILRNILCWYYPVRLG